MNWLKQRIAAIEFYFERRYFEALWERAAADDRVLIPAHPYSFQWNNAATGTSTTNYTVTSTWPLSPENPYA